jgi:hypothetical protein
MKKLYLVLSLLVASNYSCAQDDNLTQKIEKVAEEFKNAAQKAYQITKTTVENVADKVAGAIDEEMIQSGLQTLDKIALDETTGMDLKSPLESSEVVSSSNGQTLISDLSAQSSVQDLNTLSATTDGLQKNTSVVVPAPRYSEKDGYVLFYGYPIFDTSSDRAHIEEQRAKTSVEALQALESGKTPEQVDKALLAAWKKDHPVVVTTFDKMVASGAFASVVAICLWYQYWNRPSDEDDQNSN